MQRCCEASGVPFIRIHDLRHSHVSLLIELGFTVQLIAERIGDTVQMVLSTYEHLYPNRHQEVSDKLNDLIVSKKGFPYWEPYIFMLDYDYSIIVATLPEPTVLPPSRIANVRPWLIAIGWMSSIVISTLSPGMHISVPAGRLHTPVTSVVLK